MFSNTVHLQKNGRVRGDNGNRNKSQPKAKQNLNEKRFRMTQKIVKLGPRQQKKIKSEAVSPDDIKINKIANLETDEYKNVNLKKCLTLRTESSKQYPFHNNSNTNKIIFNPDFKVNIKSARLVQQIKKEVKPALNAYSPEAIKIKTSGLVVQNLCSLPNSLQKKSGTNSNTIYTKLFPHKKEVQAKFHFHDKKKTQDSAPKEKINLEQQNCQCLQRKHKIQNILGKNLSVYDLSDFQREQAKRYQIFYKGLRRIHLKTDFTDLEGFPLCQIADSIAYRYQILQQIGKGAFGRVFKCKDHKKNQVIALKIIRSLPKLNKQAKIQVQILQKVSSNLDQQNIVRLKGSFLFRGHSCITYELLSLNLFEYLQARHFQSTPQNILIKFAIQILHALLFLKKFDIVHCDIKPENILLKDINKTGVKLIDFGSSCYEETQFYTYIQSRYYRAPEVILGIKYTCSIDIWSFGCVLAQLHSGYPLFPGDSEDQQLELYRQLLGKPPKSLLEKGTRKKTFFNQQSPQQKQKQERGKFGKNNTFEKALNSHNRLFTDFLRKCIEWDPQKRIRPKEALLHEWILEGIPPNIRSKHIEQVNSES